MKYTILFVLLFIIYSCCNNSNAIRHARGESAYKFKLSTIKTDYNNLEIFSTSFLTKGKKRKKYPQNDKIYVEYQVSFDDGSVFYLSNDILNGSQLNRTNLYQIGINGYNKKYPLDTIIYSGISDSLHWKEAILGEITIGYINATNPKKEEFEKAILELKKN
jgi:hypothetical protein